MGLSEPERQAVILGHDVRDQLAYWLARQGIASAGLVVSPFVDVAGSPSVLVRLDGVAARRVLRALCQG